MSRIALKTGLQPELFVYSFPVRVYYESTDAGGVVYHAEYFKFLERARTEWLRHLGFEHQGLARDHGMLLVVTSIAIDFMKPARIAVPEELANVRRWHKALTERPSAAA